MTNGDGLFDDIASHIFGTPKYKLVRRDDPQTSHAAAASVETTKLEKVVYDTIRSCGESGCISDEVRSMLASRDLSYSSVTARYKSLHEKGLIRYTGGRRPGHSGRNQNIMVAV
jgi:DNA-binding MarR family transcriptional regulator